MHKRKLIEISGGELKPKTSVEFSKDVVLEKLNLGTERNIKILLKQKTEDFNSNSANKSNNQDQEHIKEKFEDKKLVKDDVKEKQSEKMMKESNDYVSVGKVKQNTQGRLHISDEEKDKMPRKRLKYRPYMCTKGTMCRPAAKSKGTITDQLDYVQDVKAYQVMCMKYKDPIIEFFKTLPKEPDEEALFLKIMGEALHEPPDRDAFQGCSPPRKKKKIESIPDNSASTKIPKHVRFLDQVDLKPYNYTPECLTPPETPKHDDNHIFEKKLYSCGPMDTSVKSKDGQLCSSSLDNDLTSSFAQNEELKSFVLAAKSNTSDYSNFEQMHHDYDGVPSSMFQASRSCEVFKTEHNSHTSLNMNDTTRSHFLASDSVETTALSKKAFCMDMNSNSEYGDIDPSQSPLHVYNKINTKNICDNNSKNVTINSTNDTVCCKNINEMNELLPSEDIDVIGSTNQEYFGTDSLLSLLGSEEIDIGLDMASNLERDMQHNPVDFLMKEDQLSNFRQAVLSKSDELSIVIPSPEKYDQTNLKETIVFSDNSPLVTVKSRHLPPPQTKSESTVADISKNNCVQDHINLNSVRVLHNQNQRGGCDQLLGHSKIEIIATDTIETNNSQEESTAYETVCLTPIKGNSFSSNGVQNESKLGLVTDGFENTCLLAPDNCEIVSITPVEINSRNIQNNVSIKLNTPLDKIDCKISKQQIKSYKIGSINPVKSSVHHSSTITSLQHKPQISVLTSENQLKFSGKTPVLKMLKPGQLINVAKTGSANSVSSYRGEQHQLLGNLLKNQSHTYISKAYSPKKEANQSVNLDLREKISQPQPVIEEKSKDNVIDVWNKWISKTTEDNPVYSTISCKKSIIALQPWELNNCLCMFVHEVRKQDGQQYHPIEIYYLCCALQSYLIENYSQHNIFVQVHYETFRHSLNYILGKKEQLHSKLIYYIEEEDLWRSKQLGNQCPLTLLFTLMYINTKYAGFKSLEDHVQLKFGNVKKVKKNGVANVYFYSKYNASDYGTFVKDCDKLPGKVTSNLEDVSRCPMSLYACYISRGLKNISADKYFYCQPECTTTSQSPVWYTSVQLSCQIMEKMFNRISVIKEIISITMQ